MQSITKIEENFKSVVRLSANSCSVFSVVEFITLMAVRSDLHSFMSDSYQHGYAMSILKVSEPANKVSSCPKYHLAHYFVL